jgi:hypothetical protein
MKSLKSKVYHHRTLRQKVTASYRSGYFHFFSCKKLLLLSGVTILASSLFSSELFADNDLTYDINLKRGWNLFAMPVDKSANLYDFRSQGCYLYGRAWGLRSGRYFTTHTLQPQNGYWVYAFRACSLKIKGKPQAVKKRTLTSGWNLIGGPGMYSSPKLYNGSCKIESIYNYSSWRWKKEDYMNPGEARFVKVSNTCELQLKKYF